MTNRLSHGFVLLAPFTFADLSTMFIGEPVNVTLQGIVWEQSEEPGNDTMFFYETFVNGELQAKGNYSLEGVGRELPSEAFVGTVTSDTKGTTTISVTVTLDDVVSETDASFQTYKPGLSIVPLLVVLLLAMTTRMVEFSLYMGVFVGACIAAGNINDGFKNTLDKYILGALADADHVYVILFTLFLSGLVGMMVSQTIFYVRYDAMLHLSKAAFSTSISHQSPLHSLIHSKNLVV